MTRTIGDALEQVGFEVTEKLDGSSFGEIFFGNCVILGTRRLGATQADLKWLQKVIGRTPRSGHDGCAKQKVRFGDRVLTDRCSLPGHGGAGELQ